MRWLLSKNSHKAGILVQPFNYFNYYTHARARARTIHSFWHLGWLLSLTSYKSCCCHSEELVKTKVRSLCLLAEAELLHRKGKFVETERTIKGYTTEKLAVETWSLLAAWINHLCGMVQRCSCTYCWALGDSLLSMLWPLLILLKCPILNWGIWVLNWDIETFAFLLLFWQLMSKTTALQESKLENSICGCLKTRYHQMNK